MADLKTLREKLFEHNEKLHKSMNVKLGETAAPGYMGRCAIEDMTRIPLNEEYIRQLAPEYKAFAGKVRETLNAISPFDCGEPLTAENVWLWGGPTPEWGGSSLKDTLMRTAKYFSRKRCLCLRANHRKK